MDLTPEAPQQITNQNRVHYDGSSEGAGYCLYKPPTSSDSLILFLHGFQFGVEVGAYDPMVQFLVSHSGFYVVYPYGPDLFRTGTYPHRAIDALGHALAVLKSQDQVDVRKLAVVGHSLGGMAALRVAAEWKGAPAINALVVIEPGPPLDSDAMRDLKLSGCDATGCESWDVEEGLKPIPCGTRLLIIQAHGGPCVCRPDRPCSCQSLWDKLPQIARYVGSGQTPQRNFLRVLDDTSHSNPAPGVLGPTIPSTHLGTTVVAPFICGVMTKFKDDYGCYLTYMDYWGYWRPTLAAVQEAFTGKPVLPDYSPYCSSEGKTGTCSTTRDMGKWQSDGKSATSLLNAADIPELAANYPDYCPR